MIDANLPGPCADYEHDIVELLDGSLTSERAVAVRNHVEACIRCRAWHDEFAAVDLGLAAALPRPELSPGFASRLQQELQALTRSPRRVDLLAEEESRYRSIMESLRASARRSALVNAIVAVGIVACSIALAGALLPHIASMLPAIEGNARGAALGAAGAVIALGVLAWSWLRGGLPNLRLTA